MDLPLVHDTQAACSLRRRGIKQQQFLCLGNEETTTTLVSGCWGVKEVQEQMSQLMFCTHE